MCIGRLGWAGWGYRGNELAHLRRAGLEWLEAGQGSSLVADQKLAIELLSDLDAAMGVGATARARVDGEAVAVERDGVVIGNNPFVLEAEDGVRK